MASPKTQIDDVAGVLAELLEDVPNLRVYAYVADSVRPPAAVVGQPTLDFNDPDSAFCAATWNFPITVMTTRSNDREAQSAMSRLLLDIVNALGEPVPGILDIQPIDARPVPVTVSGQELPGYLLNIRIRA